MLDLCWTCAAEMRWLKHRQHNGLHQAGSWLKQTHLRTPGKRPSLQGLELGGACGNRQVWAQH